MFFWNPVILSFCINFWAWCNLCRRRVGCVEELALADVFVLGEGSELVFIFWFVFPINILYLSKIKFVHACIKTLFFSRISHSLDVDEFSNLTFLNYEKCIQSTYFLRGEPMEDPLTPSTSSKLFNLHIFFLHIKKQTKYISTTCWLHSQAWLGPAVRCLYLSHGDRLLWGIHLFSFSLFETRQLLPLKLQKSKKKM